MKARIGLLLLIALLTNFSCDQENVPVDEYGRISFRVNNSILRTGKSSGATPTSVLLSLETITGKSIYQNKLFPISLVDQNFVTDETIMLSSGSYMITKFLVLADKKVVYASPRQGSEKSLLVSNALPGDFEVEANNYQQLAPPLVAVQDGDDALDFGYNNLDFNATAEPWEESEWMNVRVKFEPTISGVVYENIDAVFSVKAFDEQGIQKWSDTYSYTGPFANDLKLKNGFYRYTLEVTKWGITSKQTFFGTYLWEGRVRDGNIPTTYVFAGQADAKKVSHTINYTEVKGVLTPTGKTTYQYNSAGKVLLTSFFQYSKNTDRFILDSQNEFEYVSNRVSRIRSYSVGSDTPYEEITYLYQGARPSQITNKSVNSGITTVVNLDYDASDRKITASYQFSNGQSFEYSFTNEWNNMKSDKTTRGTQVCSEGSYTYDKNINPLKHLGYVDYLLRNYSIGNRLTEQVNYIGCAYPSLVPESYSYTYDGDSYPLVATTSYRGQSMHTQVHYFYQ